MIKNPAFGKWQTDDAFPEQCGKVENDHLTSRGPSASLWDLRGNERKALPCTVTVGQFTMRKVIFPKRKDTAKRIRGVAQKAFTLYGPKYSPYEYPPLRRVSKRLTPFYYYCLAKLITERSK